MAQEAERRVAQNESVWERLAGKTIILAGNENRQRECFRQNLAHLAGQMGGAFSVADDFSKARKGDAAFLFGMPCDGACRMDALFEAFEKVSALGLRAALVTANTVYGKKFGVPHLFAEQEPGYACHTSAEDMKIAEMRLAENLAHRLAKEEGLPAVIVRAEEELRGGAVRPALEAAVTALLCGAPGEAYNLPGNKREAGDEERSRLKPLPVVTDTRKVQSLNVRGI